MTVTKLRQQGDSEDRGRGVANLFPVTGIDSKCIQKVGAHAQRVSTISRRVAASCKVKPRWGLRFAIQDPVNFFTPHTFDL